MRGCGISESASAQVQRGTLGKVDRDLAEQPIHGMPSDAFYDHIYWDATKLLEAFIFNIDIPTIACINGPGFHTDACERNSDAPSGG